MAITSPPVAGDRYGDIAGLTEKLAGDLAGWKPPPEGATDAGRALIRAFAAMARHVVDRINRMPDRALLHFLDRIGLAPLPPRAARVPLTFTLVAKSDVEPIVPARTRVAAAALPGDRREVVFETELDLPTTRSQLVAAFVRQPDGDRAADVTAMATGAEAGIYRAFDGGAPVEHSIYLAADEVLALPAGTIVTVDVGPSAAAISWQTLLDPAANVPLAGDAYYRTTHPTPPLLRWTYWNGDWTLLAIKASATGFAFTIPADMAAVPVSGRTARWIRGTLLAWPRDALPLLNNVRISATVSGSNVAPDAAMGNGRPADLSVDFFPLGPQPRLNDSFAVACEEALSHPGTQLTVQMASTSPEVIPDSPTLAWEISTTDPSGWTSLKTTTPKITALEGTAVTDKVTTVALTVPSGVRQSAIGGQKACWLRIRLSAGDYGKGVYLNKGTPPTVTNDGYRPPVLNKIVIASYTRPVTASGPTVGCVLRRDGAFIDCTGKSSFAPFVRSTDLQKPAFHLGFSRRFAQNDAMLYVQVAPLAPEDAAKDASTSAASGVLWEYSRGTAEWAPLPCEDGTKGLSTSGLVRFVGPADLTARAERGLVLFWIRARLLPAVTADAAIQSTRLGRVLTNTVWASDALTLRGEVLGSSDGNQVQTFSLAARPVLEGQRIEVREPAIPPEGERDALEALEGEDAVTVTGNPAQPDEVWVRWHEAPDLLAAGPRDRFYTIDRARGTIAFGDGLRGMVPPRGRRNVRAASYRAGGGADGNRAALSISQLKTTLPYVDGVVNTEPSMAGADLEDVDRVKEWGPRVLRHGYRAVAAEDFEDLARAASSEVARAKAITSVFDPIRLADTPAPPPPIDGVPVAGSVLLLLVTSGAEVPPTPSVALLHDVQARVQERAAPTVALRVAGPRWVKVSVEGATPGSPGLTVFASSPSGLDALRERIERSIVAFLHPIEGHGGRGWDFGQFPHDSDVYGLVMSIPGVDRVGALDLKLDPVLAPGDPAATRSVIYPGDCHVRVLLPSDF